MTPTWPRATLTLNEWEWKKMREFESSVTYDRPDVMLLRKTDEGDVIDCSNCGSFVPTIFSQKRVGEKCDRYMCEVCYSTHLSRMLVYGQPVTNEDLAKGLAWCVNRILTELRDN